MNATTQLQALARTARCEAELLRSLAKSPELRMHNASSAHSLLKIAERLDRAAARSEWLQCSRCGKFSADVEHVPGTADYFQCQACTERVNEVSKS